MGSPAFGEGTERNLANDQTSQDDRASPQKPRRKPLTIDLPAEEVARKPGDAGVAPNASSASTASASSTASAASANPREGKEATSAPLKGGERSTSSQPIPSAFAAKISGGSGAAKSEAPPDAEAGGRSSLIPILLAGAAGGAVVAIAFGLLFSFGYLVPPQGAENEVGDEIAVLKGELDSLKQQPDHLAPLQEEVSALQKSVSELTGRPPSAGPDPAALKEIEDRLAAVEIAREAAPPGTDFAPQIAAIARDVEALKNVAPPDTTSLQSDMSALQSNIGAVKQQVDALSAGLANVPKEERVAALEAKLDETSERIASAAALAPAVAADALAGALDAGRPFESELAALKALGADAQAIDALAPHAATGLPTIAALRAEFDQAMDQVALATPIPENTGTIDRLLESARGLVEVRPAHPTEGNDPGAIVARIRGALAAGDLKTALRRMERAS